MTEFDTNQQPPNHMPIAYGPVKSTKKGLTKAKKKNGEALLDEENVPVEDLSNCSVCDRRVQVCRSGNIYHVDVAL